MAELEPIGEGRKVYKDEFWNEYTRIANHTAIISLKHVIIDAWFGRLIALTFFELVMGAFFHTPDDVREEVQALHGAVVQKRREIWRQLFESVPLADGVNREEAFELVTIVIDAFDQMFLEEISFEKEPNDAPVKRFLERRNRFLLMVRRGIEKQRKDDDA